MFALIEYLMIIAIIIGALVGIGIMIVLAYELIDHAIYQYKQHRLKVYYDRWYREL